MSLVTNNTAKQGRNNGGKRGVRKRRKRLDELLSLLHQEQHLEGAIKTWMTLPRAARTQDVRGKGTESETEREKKKKKDSVRVIFYLKTFPSNICSSFHVASIHAIDG